MNFFEKHSIGCGSKQLDLSVPAVMGIVNVTPDSFFDGGQYDSPFLILQKVEQMIDQGASIIDIGALSTRPGALSVSCELEIQRLMPHLQAIRKEFPDIILSVDTFRKEVAEAALSEGADIINDVSGGVNDPEMIEYMCKQHAAYIMMHMQGNPQTMQINPVYDDVVKEVGDFFLKQLVTFQAAGKNNIILDPGFGFGKSVDHNYRLLHGLSTYKTIGYPILAGISRKSMINKVIGTSPANALNGTTAVNVIALLQGANILRVHDVKPAMEAIKLVEQFNQSNVIR